MEIFLGTVNMFSVLKLNRDYLSRSEQCLVLFLLNVPDSIDNNVFYAYSQVLLCLEIYALLIRSVLHLLYFKFCAFHHWHTSSSAFFLVSYSCLIPQFILKMTSHSANKNGYILTFVSFCVFCGHFCLFVYWSFSYILCFLILFLQCVCLVSFLCFAFCFFFHSSCLPVHFLKRERKH